MLYGGLAAELVREYSVVNYGWHLLNVNKHLSLLALFTQIQHIINTYLIFLSITNAHCNYRLGVHQDALLWPISL